MVKLSLCLIVKPSNKEAEFLDRCLSSVSKYVDEIVLTITGGKGEAKEVEKVGKNYGARLTYFKWVDDFAKARNYNFSQARGKYILWLDTDDILKEADKLPTIIERMEKDEIDVGVMDYLYDFDEYGNCIVKHRKSRIIRNDGCVKWVGRIHEDFTNLREVKAYYIKGVQVVHLTNNERIYESKLRNLRIALDEYKRNPKDPRNWWNVANAYLSLGKNKQALKYYKGFLKRSASEIEQLTAYHRMAGASLGLGDYKNAIRYEFKVIEIRPWFPDGYLGLGEIYYRMGEYKKAKEFLVQGLSKEVPVDEYIVWNPRDYDFNPLRLLADCYMHLSKPKEAKKCIDACLNIYPNHKQLLYIQEKLKEEIEKLDEVDRIYEKAKNIQDKEKLKELLDDIPTDLKSHPKIVYLRNINFIKKESSGRDLVIYCFYTEEPFNPDILLNEGRGGSEEAVWQMSRRLARLGWNVTVYANTGLHKPKEFDGVLWKPFWEFNIRDKQDILIAWRHPMLFDFKEVNATKKYVWLHDVLSKQEFTPKRLERINKVFALSKYQRNLFPNIPDKKFMITSNGIDVGMFEELDGKIKRNPYRLIYTSSYDRGLALLLKLFPKIKKEFPQAELHIFYGWNVWDVMYKNDPIKQKEKEEIIRMMKQDGVYHHGRVSQEQIIKEYFKSSILAYPTEFTEISCITAIKSQAAGAIPITTNVAALDETVQYGLKVDSNDIYTDKRAQEEWLNGILSTLEHKPSEEERKEMMEWARKTYNWNKIAEQWDKEFKR